jgi:HJR/Mrr/RecB family endonuclease
VATSALALCLSKVVGCTLGWLGRGEGGVRGKLMEFLDFFFQGFKGFWQIIVAFIQSGGWLLLLIFVLTYKYKSIARLLQSIRERGRQARYFEQAQTIQHILSLSPTDFEHYIADLFRRQGYRVTQTGQTGDHGVDVRAEKDGLKFVVQCKRYTDRAVGEPAIRDFYGTMTREGADHGFFLTTSRYTKQAQEWAKGKAITLIDKDGLLKMVRQHR